MRINTNVAALNTQRILTQTDASAAKAIGRLSSGYRINNASDDAAGLAISNKLNATVRSLQQASRNAQQADSVMQIMQGGASQIESILERMKELATQSNSDTVDTAARTQLNSEFTSLKNEITRITATTQFNGNNLLDGTFGASVDTATGAGHSTVLAASTTVYGADINGTGAGTYTVDNSTAGTITITGPDGTTAQSMAVGSDGAQDVQFSTFGITLHLTADYSAAGTAAGGDLVVSGATAGSFMVSSSGNYNGSDLLTMNGQDLTTGATGLNVSGNTIDTAANAQSALTAIDSALSTVNSALGDIGALQNRISFASQNTASLIQNTQAAVSTIKDADMAQQMTEFSRLQILQQAGTAMLAQANQAPQQVLQLFR